MKRLRRWLCGRRGHHFVEMTMLKPESAYMWEYTCRCGDHVEVWSYFGKVRRVS